jgi:hypothetical protein
LLEAVGLDPRFPHANEVSMPPFLSGGLAAFSNLSF